MSALFCSRNYEELLVFFDSYFGAANGFAGEATNAALLVSNNTIVFGVYRVVTAQLGAFAGALAEADLANDYLAGLNLLATIQLNTEALTLAVAGIFGGTASFDV